YLDLPSLCLTSKLCHKRHNGTTCHHNPRPWHSLELVLRKDELRESLFFPLEIWCIKRHSPTRPALQSSFDPACFSLADGLSRLTLLVSWRDSPGHHSHLCLNSPASIAANPSSLVANRLWDGRTRRRRTAEWIIR